MAARLRAPGTAGVSALRAWLLGLAVPASLAVGAPSLAEIPVCSAETAGQLSRQVNVQCACRWFTRSRLGGTPAGYRWDCGILRARLNHTVPVDLNPYPYLLPDALSLDQTIIQEPRPLRPPAYR